MLTYTLSGSNLLPSDVLPNEANFKDTERISAKVIITVKYKHKSDSQIHLSFFMLPCGKKTVEQLLLEHIPLYLSNKQRSVYEKNGANVVSLWSNRKWSV